MKKITVQQEILRAGNEQLRIGEKDGRQYF